MNGIGRHWNRFSARRLAAQAISRLGNNKTVKKNIHKTFRKVFPYVIQQSKRIDFRNVSIVDVAYQIYIAFSIKFFAQNYSGKWIFHVIRRHTFSRASINWLAKP